MTSFQFVAGIVVLQAIVYVPITTCIKHVEYNLTTNLCNPLRKPFTLPHQLSDETPVIIVNSYNKFLKWPTNPVDYCDFVIETKDKRNGIFAVIQHISFRNGTSGSCTDSITFMRNDRHRTTLCGQYHRYKHMLFNDAPFQSSRFYSEYSPREQIRTIVEVSSEMLSPDFSIGFSIAYTLYKDCNRTDPKRYQRVVRDLNICIPKECFCDDIYNCGGMDYCLDEESCETPIHVVSDETGTKVTVAVVTTILQCFVIFIVCLWICRRQKKLCWSADCAGPAAERNTPALSIDIDHRSQSHTVSSAPMLEEVMLNAVQDKDLPPSYDSLFPENANLSNP